MRFNNMFYSRGSPTPTAGIPGWGQNGFARQGASGFVFFGLASKMGSFGNFAIWPQQRNETTETPSLFVDWRTLRSCNSHIARFAK
jgi:hypothetical protein